MTAGHREWRQAREPPVLCRTTYSWGHPGSREVTGCIRRMVRGWRVQIPAYAGMMGRDAGNDIRRGNGGSGCETEWKST